MKDYAKFIASLILFGSNGVVAAHILLPSQDIVALRTLIGSLFLGAVFLTRRPKPNIASAQDLAFVVASGVSMGLSWLFLYEAYQTVGVAVSSLAYYCAPIMVMALSPIVFKETLSARVVASFAIVLTGALLLNCGSIGSGESSMWGLFCGWMSAVCHAAMVIFSKLADKIEGITSSLIQLGCSFAIALAFLVVTGGLPFEVGAESWGWVLVLGVVNTGLGCYLYFSSFGDLSVQSVAILGYLEPLSSVVCALVFLGEPFGTLEALGGCLIMLGALTGTLRKEENDRVGD